MKGLMRAVPMLGIFACIGVSVMGFIIPFVFEPVQVALSPFACQEGWRLDSESHSCQTDSGTGTCSNMICVSPDGRTTQAWKLLIFDGGMLCGSMLFTLLMVVLILRNQMNAGPPGGAFGPTITVAGMGSPPPVQVITPNMGTNMPIQIQIQDMKVPLDEQIAKLDRLRENGTLTWEQYEQAVEGVRKAYGDL